MTALTRPFEQAFRAARIPYQIVGGVSFYERQEVKDVLAYLNLMANPKDDLAFARVVNVPPRGLGKTSLDIWSRRRGSGTSRSWPWPGRPTRSPDSRTRPLAAWRNSPGWSTSWRRSATTRPKRSSAGSWTAPAIASILAGDSRDNGEDRLANLDELISAAREFDQDASRRIDPRLPGRGHAGLAHRPLGPANRQP